MHPNLTGDEKLSAQVTPTLPGHAKTLRIMLYTQNWGRLPKVGFRACPGTALKLLAFLAFLGILPNIFIVHYLSTKHPSYSYECSHWPCQSSYKAVHHLLHGPLATRYPPEAESPRQYASACVQSMPKSLPETYPPSTWSKPFQLPFESLGHPF